MREKPLVIVYRPVGAPKVGRLARSGSLCEIELLCGATCYAHIDSVKLVPKLTPELLAAMVPSLSDRSRDNSIAI